METVSDFLDLLGYGKSNAKTADTLFKQLKSNITASHFARDLRYLSGEARKLGHRVIGDDKGYYMALNEKEWEDYSRRRLGAIKDELVSLAGAQRISVQDLIKTVYAVNVQDKNYSLQL